MQGESSNSGWNESEMIGCAVAGDKLSLERLLQRHSRALEAHVQIPAMLRSFLSVQDVLQEVYFEAFRHIATFQPRGTNSFLNWLLVIADSRIANARNAHFALKRGAGQVISETAINNDKDESIAALLQEYVVYERTPSTSAMSHEAYFALKQAVCSLNHDHRRAIELRFFDGLRMKQVGEKMNRTEEAAQMLLLRAIRSLKELLGQQGITA